MNKKLFIGLVVVGLLFPSTVLAEKPSFCEVLTNVTEIVCPTPPPPPIFEPTVCNEIDRQTMIDLLLPILGEEQPWDTYFAAWDELYNLIDVGDLRKFLETVDYKRKKGMDCDDHARILQGRVLEWMPNLGFALVIIVSWSEEKQVWGRHAKNLFVDCDYEIWSVDGVGVSPWDEDADFILMKGK